MKDLANLLSTDVQNFLLISELGSLSSVARKTGRDSGNLSRSLVRLESTLGGALFVRHKTGLGLTQKGREFLQAIKNSQSAFPASLSEPRQGLVRIGFSSAVGFGFFSEQLINTILELNLSPRFTLRPTIELFELLKKRELDFVLAPRTLNFPGVIAKTYAPDRLVLCSQNGQPRKVLLMSSQMFDLERITGLIEHAERWMVDDYFVVAKLLSESRQLMGVVPEKLLSFFPRIRIIESLKEEGKITAISWKGSTGIELLRKLN